MEALDNILDNATNPTTGILHGAVFIAVDRSGIISRLFPNCLDYKLYVLRYILKTSRQNNLQPRLRARPSRHCQREASSTRLALLDCVDDETRHGCCGCAVG